MKKTLAIVLVSIFFLLGFVKYNKTISKGFETIDELRKAYSSGDYKQWPKPNLDETIDVSKFEDIGVLPKVPYPATNLYSKEKADLGKTLFFDPRLSVSGQISCANCHNPELGWTDNLTRSFGHDRQNGGRNAMTILNSGFATSLFWDGRAPSLEAQAVGPIQDKLEMNMHLELAISKINSIAGYKPMFEAAFENKAISKENIQKAIATFERTVVSPMSKFDRFVSGKTDELTNQEVQGLHLFRTKARCINCHNTPYFSDNQFHNDGQTLFGTINEDFGLFNVTKKKQDIGKFKTPTLREVARTGPWMHHGHFPFLIDVVQLYNLGNPSPIQKKYEGTARDTMKPVTSPILRKLDLSKEEEKALVAFLGTITTLTVRMKMPPMPK